MTEFDRLRLQVRTLTKGNEALAARVATLEAAVHNLSPQGDISDCHIPVNGHSAPRAPRPRYATIRQSALDGRHNLWTEYFFLKQAEVMGQVYNRRRGQHPPTSKVFFAENVRVNGGERLSAREFQRWFQLTNTVAEGSAQDRRIRAAIEAEIGRLRAAGYTIGRVSRGTP